MEKSKYPILSEKMKKHKKSRDVDSSTILALIFLFFLTLVFFGPTFTAILDGATKSDIYIVILILGTMAFLQMMNTFVWKKSREEDEFDLEEVVGKVDNADLWVRNRFLLMNVLAILAASFGLESIKMNHIIFWGALILGGLIWGFPAGSKENQFSTEEMFDD